MRSLRKNSNSARPHTIWQLDITIVSKRANKKVEVNERREGLRENTRFKEIVLFGWPVRRCCAARTADHHRRRVASPAAFDEHINEKRTARLEEEAFFCSCVALLLLSCCCCCCCCSTLFSFYFQLLSLSRFSLFAGLFFYWFDNRFKAISLVKTTSSERGYE